MHEAKESSEQLSSTISLEVQKGIKTNDIHSGQLTLTTLDKKLKELGKDMMNKIHSKFEEVSGSFPRIDDGGNAPVEYIGTGSIQHSEDVTLDVWIDCTKSCF